jgi:hypothetical protein
MSMDALGSAAIGTAIGWVLPVIARRSPGAILSSFVEAGLLVAVVAVAIGLQAGAAAAAGIAVSATVHAAWREQLAGRQEA